MPAPVNKCPEWIEIYNNSGQIINDIFYIKDANDTKYKINLRLLPKQFGVICKDTALLKQFISIPPLSNLIQAKLPSFNNTGDFIYLFDNNQIIIDSLEYKQIKSTNGISIERVSSEIYFDNSNFVLCKSRDSSTCGYINSVSGANDPHSTGELGSADSSNAEISISKNPFNKSTDTDCIISIKSHTDNSYCLIKLLDINGNLIENCTSIINIGKDYQLDIAQNLLKLTVGAYIINISITDNLSGNSKSYNLLIAVGDNN